MDRGSATPTPGPTHPCNTIKTNSILPRPPEQVASAGRIVLLSVHQPSPAMFNMLDRAYLLAGGACVFCGPPTAAEAHFAAHGMPCPVGAAIAEHMLQVGQTRVTWVIMSVRVVFTELISQCPVGAAFL